MVSSISTSLCVWEPMHAAGSPAGGGTLPISYAPLRPPFAGGIDTGCARSKWPRGARFPCCRQQDAPKAEALLLLAGIRHACAKCAGPSAGHFGPAPQEEAVHPARAPPSGFPPPARPVRGDLKRPAAKL